MPNFSTKLLITDMAMAIRNAWKAAIDNTHDFVFCDMHVKKQLRDMLREKAKTKVSIT